MFCHAAVMLLPLLAVSAPATSSQSSTTGGDSSVQASGFAPSRRPAEIRSRDHVRFFVPPEDSTLPPVVTSAAWKRSSSVENDRKKGGSAGDKLRPSRWTNEIVRRGSFPADNDQEKKTENPTSETSATKPTGLKPDVKRNFAENKESFEVDRKGSDAGKDVPESRKEPAQRDREERENNTTGYNAEDTATSEEKSDFDAEDEVETVYDDDEDYDVDDEEYEDYDDDDDVQYYDDESNAIDEQEVDEYDEKPVDDDKRAEERQSVGREGAHFQEYEISADSSRGLDYDTTNAEVISELQVVARPARRRRRNGGQRSRTTKKTRGKRRRKRPPVEPVGRVKRPTRKQRRPTSAGASRRKTKSRRRRKGQSAGVKRKTRRRKNRRNKQTTSLSLDFGGGATGNGNKFEQRHRRQDVGESTKPRLQQSGIIQSLQQQYQQQQQHGDYTGQFGVPYYSDVYAGHDRRRTVAASTDIRGQEAATNRGVHASVSGRVPPVVHHTAQQTPQRPQSTPTQSHNFDLRRYYQLPQHQRPTYYHQPQHQPQQQQQHPRQYYQSYYQQQQQSAPTFSRHQQQIHFIVPTSDFDVRRIPQVMSALGLDDYIGGGRRSTGDGDAHPQLLDYDQPSPPSSGAYREGDPAGPVADGVRLESSLSGSGDAAARRSRHLRYQRSTSGRRRAAGTTNQDGAEAPDERGELQATRRDRSEHRADDHAADDEEYVDNSDIEITTRSFHQTTALKPF